MQRQRGLVQWPLMTWVLLVFLFAVVGFAAMKLFNQVQEIDGDIVQQALQRGKPINAEFGSDSCATCKDMTQMLQQLERDYAEQLAVVHVNIAKYPEYASKYKIMLMPTQVFFDSNGYETGRHMGAMGRQQILQELGITAEDS